MMSSTEASRCVTAASWAAALIPGALGKRVASSFSAAVPLFRLADAAWGSRSGQADICINTWTRQQVRISLCQPDLITLF